MSLCCSDSTTSPEGCMSIVEEKQPSNLTASVKLSYRTYKSNEWKIKVGGETYLRKQNNYVSCETYLQNKY